VITDTVDQVWLMTNDWFPVDMQMLASLYNVPMTTTATVIKRQSVETALAEGATIPVLGIVALRCTTNAKDQGKRDSLTTVEWDYYAEAATVASLGVLQKQVELAAQAILYTIDRLAGSGLQVFGGGDLPGSVEVTVTEGVNEGEAPRYWRRAVVTAPIWQRENIN
jgi:hypothetical protein